MNASLADNVADFLAVIGAGSNASGHRANLTIDRFDHWSNPGGERSVTLCQCFTSDDEPTAKAA